MLDAHPSVSMQSEVVKMVIHWNRVDTEAAFVFVNHGKACKVNMGFPDFGLGAYAHLRKQPVTMFKDFHSFVDGKPVETKLVLGQRLGEQWRTKTVSFAENGKRAVREVYTTKLGGAAERGRPLALACYLLHTGASWTGNIGTATILVTFDPDSEVAAPLNVLFDDKGGLAAQELENQAGKPGGVLAAGPSAPSIQGRTLRFEMRNWRPSGWDDISVGFAYPKRAVQWEEEQAKKRAVQPRKRSN